MKKETSPLIKTSDITNECPACGLMTKSGDYCHNCGYHLMETERRSSHNWWYCQRDSAIMAEMDSNQQIPISRESVDESLMQAINNRLLEPHDREKAKNLALQILDEGIASKFTVITKVRCPACGSYSYAPVTKRPRQVSQYGSLRQFTLNAGSILRTGVYYLRNYPLLMIIIIIGVGLDSITFVMGLSSYSFLSLDTMFLGTSTLNTVSYDTSNLFNFFLFLIVSTLITLVINCFLQTWYLSSLKEIREKEKRNVNILESLKASLRFIPRVLMAQLIITGFTTVLSLITLLISGSVLSENVYDMGYNSILFYLFLFLAILVGITGLTFILSILFAYVQGSIIFGGSGVIKSFNDSYKFARKYFWTTFGVIIVFNFLGGIISIPTAMILGSTLFLFPAGTFSFLFVTAAVSSIVARGVEAYKTLSIGWAYDEFKSTIE
jgi:ribosomal protein L32